MLLEEIPNLSHADPKVSKGAALRLLQHVSENKGELDYLVKRLVTGMESMKVSTRAGSYTSLTTLLSLRKVNPFELFDVMEKCLITNKESTKKERRLIYIARILCTGAIFRTIPAVNLAKDVNFLPVALKELVDLSLKKSTYFLLTTPFLSHLLQDNTLTQETFDSKVWPTISPLFGPNNQSKADKKKKLKAEQDDETSDEDEDKEGSDEGMTNWNKLCCQVQLALNCKNGEYKTEFECLKDPGKIAKALLTSNLQFEEDLLKSLFKHLSASSTDQIQTFWETVLDNIKSTQFDLLCLSVKTSIEANLPISGVLSRKLVRLLLSVFKLEDKDFHRKSKETIDLLLKWGKSKKGGEGKAKDKATSLGKKERKSMLKILFDVEDPPNLLHEYKFLHPVIRPFLLRLTSRELEHLHGILLANLFENHEASKLGPRMAIVYLQTLGKIAHCHEASPELRFKIGEKLLNIGLGKEEVPIKSKKEGDSAGEEENNAKEAEDEPDPESSFKGVHEQLKKCSLSTLHLILSSTYNTEFISMMSNYIIENLSEFSSNPATLKSFKDIKKALKKNSGGHPHLEYILRAYGIRVLLDEGQPVSATNDNVETLMELMKTCKKGEDLTELWKFITESVVREPNPPFHYEGLFNKLLMEGKVNEEVMQVFAEAIDVELEPEADDDEEESDEEDDETKMEVDKDGEEADSDSKEESGDESNTPPPKKKSKLDPAQIAKLREEFGGESDSEESIALDEATEEDLQKMDGALAKVFGVKKSMKEEERSGERALMRTLRLVDLYIRRHIKDMLVSSLLLLLMPVVHSLQRSLKLRKSQLPTRVIGILDNLNRVKKFTGCDMVVEGTLATLAEELYEMGQQKKNKLIRELLDHSVILMTKCFIQKEGKRSKKEQKKFIAIYCKAVDIAKSKIKGRRKTSGKKGKNKQLRIGGGNLNTSRFVRLALETFSEWEEGKKAIQDRINVEVEN